MMSVMYDRRHVLWISIINRYDGSPLNMNMMGVHHLWIWWMPIIYEYDEYLSFKKMMNVHQLWIWWMSIIYEYGGPSFMMYACRVLWMNMVVHHLYCMHVVYCGCQSYMMDVHHIWDITVINDVCPSCMWASFMMEWMESFSRRNKCKRYDGFCSNDWTDGIGS